MNFSTDAECDPVWNEKTCDSLSRGTWRLVPEHKTNVAFTADLNNKSDTNIDHEIGGSFLDGC